MADGQQDHKAFCVSADSQSFVLRLFILITILSRDRMETITPTDMLTSALTWSQPSLSSLVTSNRGTTPSPGFSSTIFRSTNVPFLEARGRTHGLCPLSAPAHVLSPSFLCPSASLKNRLVTQRREIRFKEKGKVVRSHVFTSGLQKKQRNASQRPRCSLRGGQFFSLREET